MELKTNMSICWAPRNSFWFQSYGIWLSNSPHITLIFLVGLHTSFNFLGRKSCFYFSPIPSPETLLVLLLPTMDTHVWSIALVVAMSRCREEQGMAAECCCNYRWLLQMNSQHIWWVMMAVTELEWDLPPGKIWLEWGNVPWRRCTPRSTPTVTTVHCTM